MALEEVSGFHSPTDRPTFPSLEPGCFFLLCLFTNTYFKISSYGHFPRTAFPTVPPLLKPSSIKRTLCYSMTLEFCVQLPHVADVSLLDTTPQTESLPTTRKHTCLWKGSPILPINQRDYCFLTKPVRLSSQRGETSLADQFSSSLATCHSPLCFSHLILQYCSATRPSLLHPCFACYRSPQRSRLGLPPQRHIALCLLFKLFIKERGRQERNCHSQWFCYVTSISLHFSAAKRSFRERFVNRYARCAVLWNMWKHDDI